MSNPVLLPSSLRLTPSIYYGKNIRGSQSSGLATTPLVMNGAHVKNTIVETSMLGAVVMSAYPSGNAEVSTAYLINGSRLRVTCTGTLSYTAAPTIALTLRFAAQPMAIATFTPTAGSGNPFRFQADISVTAGTVTSDAYVMFRALGTSSTPQFIDGSSAAGIPYVTNAPSFSVDMTATWSAASNQNDILPDSFIIESLN